MVTSIKVKFHQNFDIFHGKISTAFDFGSYWESNFYFWSKITSKILNKWQLWPKNVVTQILQSLYYNFNSILDDNRKRKVCEECFVQAKLSSKNLTEKIQNKEPFYDEPLPILCNDAVVLGNYKKTHFGFWASHFLLNTFVHFFKKMTLCHCF